jgi:DNA-binding transcriptional LysR family regulator
MVAFDDLSAFLAVARAGGFRDAAKSGGVSASGLSEAVRRLETQLGIRLLNRTTRSVVPTEAGRGLIERLGPALREVEAALDVVNTFRDRPAGTLRLNVPVSAARLVLPAIIPGFLTAYPDVRIEVVTEEKFVDILAGGFDAGIRYEDRLAQDMIAVPIGPRIQRFALGASPDYLARRGTPAHPRELLDHACLRSRFPNGSMISWEFEKDDEAVSLDPPSPLIVTAGGGSELAVDAAIAGLGIVGLFETWLSPHFQSGALRPILEDWWISFSGPFLYYPGRRLVPAPLRAFVDYIKALPRQSA